MRRRIVVVASLTVLSLLPGSVLAADDGTGRASVSDQPLIVRHPFEQVPPLSVEPAERPGALPPLYVSFVALQTYDAYTTTTGVKGGASESNPFIGGLAGNSMAFWAIKGGATVTSIYVAERLWRQHHRAEAIAVMVASNAVMAAVAARNAPIVRAQR